MYNPTLVLSMPFLRHIGLVCVVSARARMCGIRCAPSLRYVGARFSVRDDLRFLCDCLLISYCGSTKESADSTAVWAEPEPLTHLLSKYLSQLQYRDTAPPKSAEIRSVFPSPRAPSTRPMEAPGLNPAAEAAAVVITNQELEQLRKVARDGGVGETLRELEDTLEETTDMVDELRVNLCKAQAAVEELKKEAAAEKALQAGLKQEVAAGKERLDELKQQLADADAAQALLRREAAADTRLEEKDDEVSELRIKLIEAETEVTELKIRHSKAAEQLERDAAQLRRELKVSWPRG